MAKPHTGSPAGSRKGRCTVRVSEPSGDTERGGKAAHCPADDPDARLPDGGWGWLVVAGSFVINVVMPLLSQGFGMIFSRYLMQEGSSSTVNAWLFNVHSCVWNIMGMLVRPLAQEFGWRTVAITGVLLAFAALVLSAFTPSPSFLFFSFSLLSGAGGGLVVCMSFIIVPSYFGRRRGLANAVMMAGVSTGQMVGPPILRLLQDQYGYKGATLIFAAILLNCGVGAAFFHPVEWHLKAPLQPTKSPCEKAAIKGASEADPGGGEDSEWVSLVAHTRNRSEDGTQWHGDKSTNTKYKPDKVQAASRGPAGVGLRALVGRVARSTVADLRILRSPRALIIAFGCTFFLNGVYSFVMMVPFAMQTAGHSLADAAYCISASAVASLVMRVLGSVLSDYAWFNMRIAYMTGLALTATSIFAFSLLDSVPWMMAAMTAWGLGVGTTMSIYNLVMVRFMGLENLAPTFGASALVLAIGFLTLGPLVGMIRDATGSYSVSMWVLSGYVYISLVLWAFMPAAQAYDRRRTEKETEEATS